QLSRDCRRRRRDPALRLSHGHGRDHRPVAGGGPGHWRDRPDWQEGQEELTGLGRVLVLQEEPRGGEKVCVGWCACACPRPSPGWLCECLAWLRDGCR